MKSRESASATMRNNRILKGGRPMRYGGILRWLQGQVNQMRESRRKTLAVMVAAMLGGGKAGVLGIARRIRGSARDKHKIKRVYRFLRNSSVEVEAAAISAALPSYSALVVAVS